MSWSYNESVERARQRYAQTEGLTITDIVRETDFEHISLTRPRRVTGTHLYVDVTNFNQLLRDADEAEAQNMLRLLHVFARQASKIVNGDLDGQKVHFQGPRLHALAYRPVGNASLIAAKAVLTCVALRYLGAAFNEEFDLTDSRAWKVAAGLDHGVCIATKNGTGGDRELLFLGSAANHSAKLLRPSGIRMTSAVRELLPEGFDPYLAETAAEDAWIVSMSAEVVTDLTEGFGWSWSLHTVRDRLRRDAEAYPADCFSVSVPEVKIDKNTLGRSNTKRVDAISMFADVDGFTAYIDNLAQQDPDLEEAIRSFHVLRGMMRDTAVQDFEALRIQYQGDRMQALAYLPLGNEAETALRAIRLATALTTVADEVVPYAVASATVHRLAIGLAAGEVLVSKIGEHGDRDVISLGSSTASAASIQQRLPGGEIGIDTALRERLPEWLRDIFPWSAPGKAYVAKNLTYADLELLEQSELTDRALGYVTGAGAVGSAAFVTERGRQPEEAARPWHLG